MTSGRKTTIKISPNKHPAEDW